MRSAPPVLVPVGRFILGHGLTVTLAGLVALAMGWVWHVSGAAASQGLAWLALVLLVGGLSWRLAVQEALPPGTLAWDGEDWHYEAQEQQHAMPMPVPVHVQVLWDAGSSMLVGVKVQAGRPVQASSWRGQRFAWLRAAALSAHAPGHWHAWRCAVYADDIL